MPDKSFSFYPENNLAANANMLLLLEIARSHLVWMALDGSNRNIIAFELFTINEKEASDLQQTLTYVSKHSSLSGKAFLATEIIINNEFCLPFPSAKFDKEIAADYTNVAFGEDPFSETRFESIVAEQEIISLFRIKKDVLNISRSQFSNVTVRHTWPNIIKTLLAKASLFPSDYISVRFYNTFIIVAIVKASNIHFIQSFVYENPDDVLYFLLSICSHFDLDFELVPIHISGMIDTDFNLYRELIRYFKHVVLEKADQSKLAIDIKEYPLHYFTPFFNLAV